MLDLLVINPSGAHGIYGTDLAKSLVAVEPPLWARLIAGYIRDRGYEVEIVDAEAECMSPEEVADYTIRRKPRLTCITVYGHQPSASTQQMDSALKTCELIHDASGGHLAQIMVGGHVAALPERTLRESKASYACNGEGPETVLQLLMQRAHAGIDGLVCIDGLVWRNGDQVISNKPAELIDVGKLRGRVWDLLSMREYRSHNWQAFGDLSKRQPYASIYTSLGCPYKCLSGDTLVNTVYGPIEIQKLARDFKTVPVFTYDPKTGDGKVSTARNIRKYGEERLIRVHFDDGTHIDCTPDHKFMQFSWGNGKKGSESKEWACEAQNLKSGAHVRALRIEEDAAGYPVASWKRRGRKFVHRLVSEWKLGRTLVDGEQVHHLDHNKNNWLPDNLEVCSSAKDHLSRHPEITQRMNEHNPTRNGVNDVWIENIRRAITGLRRSEEARENYRKAAAKRSADPNYIDKLSVAARRREAKGYKWYTTPEGKTYRAPEPRDKRDIAGRAGFSAHKLINHKVVRVEKLNGMRPVYCLTVKDTGWFYANNVLVKNCSFCCINAPFQTNRYRMRRPDDVVKEIAFLYNRYGVKTLKIIDEMFILNEKHYTDICEKLIELDLDLNIWAYARVDTVKPHTLTMLRKAGFRWLALGIESGSKYVRDGAQKRLKNDDIVDVVKTIQKHGINVIGNFIFGLPDDTMDSMRETLDLALNLNCEFVNFYSAMAYPGSPLYTEAVAKGWALPESWRGYSQHNSDCRPLDTRHINAASVLKFRDEAFQIYFRNRNYLSSIANKFGKDAVEHIRQMTTINLRRKLLEDTFAPVGASSEQ